jgi:Mn-containing catalase
VYLRVEKLAIELPQPDGADPNAAAAVQELLGGRFGEMSTLMNYTYQSFGFRNRSKVRPYYELVANIAAEELAHIELVSATITSLLENATTDGAPDATPLAGGKDARNSQHFIVNAQTALVQDSMGKPWTGDNVFNSGNLKLDLLHNFFLEAGARTHKMRVYEMTDNPVAREMIGYLLCRGGVHKEAYAKALEDLTGVEMTKLLPIPDTPNDKFPEARKFMDQGYHRIMYRFSPSDFNQLGEIWNGSQVDTGEPREVADGPPEGADIPEPGDLPQGFAPGISAEDVAEIGRRLG